MLTASIITNALWILYIILMDRKIDKLKRVVDELTPKNSPSRSRIYASHGLLVNFADILGVKNVRRIVVDTSVGSVATATIETLIESQHGELIAECIK